jgi:hypothetical protein
MRPHLLGTDITSQSNSSEEADQKAVSVAGTAFLVFASFGLEDEQVQSVEDKEIFPRGVIGAYIPTDAQLTESLRYYRLSYLRMLVTQHLVCGPSSFHADSLQ